MGSSATILVAGGILCALLAGYSAVVHHSEAPLAASALGVWALAPIALSYVLGRGFGRLAPGRLTDVGVGVISGIVVAVANAYYAIAIARGPADPDTAAHMGPYLFPALMVILVLLLFGVMLLVTVLKRVLKDSHAKGS